MADELTAPPAVAKPKAMELALPPFAPLATLEFPFDPPPVPPNTKSVTLTEVPVPVAVADELLVAFPPDPPRRLPLVVLKIMLPPPPVAFPTALSDVDAALEVTLSIESAAPPDPLIAPSPCPPVPPTVFAVAAALADEPVVVAVAVAGPPFPPAAPATFPEPPLPPVAVAVFVWSVEIALAVAGPPFVPGFPLVPGVPVSLSVRARAGTAAMIIALRATRIIRRNRRSVFIAVLE